MNAYDELLEFLNPNETAEAISFGEWGWGSGPDELGCREPDPPPVPFALRNKPMPLEEAKPMMQSWSFIGGYGAPKCYAVSIWTNQRVIWVTQYDGATSLNSVSRHPNNLKWPSMPGG